VAVGDGDQSRIQKKGACMNFTRAPTCAWRGAGEHQLRSFNDFIIISNQDIYPLLAAKPNNKIEK
jgi:hypothetical protein